MYYFDIFIVILLLGDICFTSKIDFEFAKRVFFYFSPQEPEMPHVLNDEINDFNYLIKHLDHIPSIKQILLYRQTVIDKIFSFIVFSTMANKITHKQTIMKYDIEKNRLPPMSCCQFLGYSVFCYPHPYAHDFKIIDERKLYNIFVTYYKAFQAIHRKRQAQSLKLLPPKNRSIEKLKKVGSSHSFIKPSVRHPRSSLSSLEMSEVLKQPNEVERLVIS